MKSHSADHLTALRTPVAAVPEPAGCVQREDLTDRALLLSDEEAQTFLLPPLAATFLRRKRPEILAQTGSRLTDRTYALALGNGYQNFERFSTPVPEWPAIAAGLQLLVQGESDSLQVVCPALDNFLNFSGRWDEWLALNQQTEEKALAAGDPRNVGWRAYDAGCVITFASRFANF